VRDPACPSSGPYLVMLVTAKSRAATFVQELSEKASDPGIASLTWISRSIVGLGLIGLAD